MGTEITLEKKRLMKFRRLIIDNPSLSTQEVLGLLSDSIARDTKSDDYIIKSIAIPYTLRYFGLSENYWNKDVRDSTVVMAQKYLMYMLRYSGIFRKISTTKIGELIRNKDHATVLHHNRIMGNFLKIDPKIRNDYMAYLDGLRQSVRANIIITNKSIDKSILSNAPKIKGVRFSPENIKLLVRIYSVFKTKPFSNKECLDELGGAFDHHDTLANNYAKLGRLVKLGYLSKFRKKNDVKQTFYKVTEHGRTKVHNTAKIS